MLCYIPFLNLYWVGVKSHMSVIDALNVITSHLVGWKLFGLRKKSIFNFYCFSGFSSTCTYYIWKIDGSKSSSINHLRFHFRAAHVLSPIVDPEPTSSSSNNDNSPINHRYTSPAPNVDNDEPEINSSQTESDNIPWNHQHTSLSSNINNSNGNHQPTKEADIPTAYETEVYTPS